VESSKDEEIDSLIDDLEIIKSFGNLKGIPFDLSERLHNKESMEYIQGLSISKPEAILCDKFFLPIMNKIVSNFPQARTSSGGWVDYMIPQSGESLPVAIEIKPLHKSNGRLNSLSSELREMKDELDRTKSNQVVRYLVGADAYDYVILTNLDDVYYFSRDAVRKFQPYFTEKFSQFIESLKLSGNVWDTAKRRDESIPRKDLDKLFFQDLKIWYQWLKEIKWKSDADESSVFLINKLIFALTLEDIGVIRFKHVLREYERSKTLYDRKGSKAVLTDFFKGVDEFLYRYYDTELFSESNDILKKVDPDRPNLDQLKSVIERLLGYSTSTSAFISGLYSYNYRFIDEDIFGKSYETFLAEERKDRGIFYTPKQLTSHMSSELVKHLFDHRVDDIIAEIDKGSLEEAKSGIESLLQVKIIDPACGSGPFLVGCLRSIFDEYKRIEQKTAWADRFNGSTLSEPEEIKIRRERTHEIRKLLGIPTGYNDKISYRGLISKIIISHIYGVDLDERALDVAKVNIWKEAIKLHPKSFVYEQLPEEESHILPDLRINFVRGDSIINPPTDEVINILSQEHKEELSQMMKLRADYISNPNNPDLINKILKQKEKIRDEVILNYHEFSGRYPLFFPLEFYFAYFDNNGNSLPFELRGFECVIGNPPWNDVRAIKKEFAVKHPEIFGDELSKFSVAARDFEPVFKIKLQNPEVKELWNQYTNEIHFVSEIIKKYYKLQGGVPTLHKTFLEKFIQLSKDAFGILIPSDFHIDKGALKLRRVVLDEWQLNELICFDNRNKVWFSIHPQFKFDMLLASKERTGKQFTAQFKVIDWAMIKDSFEYPLDLIRKLSPESLIVTEFSTMTDVKIISKIRDNHSLLHEIGVKLSTEFTEGSEGRDNDLFSKSKLEDGIEVFEGKMIHQYNSNFSGNRYWIDKIKGRERLNNSFIRSVAGAIDDEQAAIDSRVKNQLLMDFEVERLVIRRQARSTDERTLIAAIIPANKFLLDNLTYVDPFSYKKEGENVIQFYESDRNFYLLALLNSFVMDYYIRKRVSANINPYSLYELPIPEASDELKKQIISYAQALMHNSSDRKQRAEVEILIAKVLFKLSKEDMEHILDSFVYGNIDKELIKLILYKYDEL
jgi:hypothetical protein